MIPIFPQFSSLSLEDKEEVEVFTSIFPPYSDFNFVSLWVWNIDNKIELSNLNNNLVVKFQDYINSEYFYSFIGNNQVVDTIEKLLALSRQTGLRQQLKLIPFDNFLNFDIEKLRNKFSLAEDINNYDYILTVEKLAKMEGRALHQKRKMLNKFLKSYAHRVVNKSLTAPGIQDEILNFFYYWEKSRDKKREETENELNAIRRLFIKPELFNITVQCVYIETSLIGYSIFEAMNNGYAVSDFQKGDLGYKGVYELLNYSMATFLVEKSCRYINIEQDLGIEGLRRAKQDYDPNYLKKYTISLKD